MANKIDTLKEKVQKATEKVEKCRKTIERHEKQLDKKIQAVIKAVGSDLTGKNEAEIEELRAPYRSTDHSWTIYEVISKQKDIKGAVKKLAEAQRILEGHQEKLQAEQKKEDFINNNIPQVIRDFLENWKEMVIEWHVRKYDAFVKFSKELDEKQKKAYEEVGVRSGSFPNTVERKALKEMGLDYDTVKAKKARFAGGTVLYMDTFYNEEERLAWLEKTVEADKRAKMIDLMNRVNDVVGTITDATGLEISEKGNLDGIIKGTKADAKVETIGAGGYNIQCFHYRTLVHEIK